MKKCNDTKEKEDVKIVSMNLSMNKELMKRVNDASLNNNLTKAAYVRQAIEEKLKNDGF